MRTMLAISFILQSAFVWAAGTSEPEVLKTSLRGITGKVTLVRSGKETEVAEDFALKEKDIIRTSADGQVALVSAGFVVQLAPQTVVQFSLSPLEDKPALLSLIYGNIRITGRKGKGSLAYQADRVRVRTTNAVIAGQSLGPKGIEYLVHVARSDSEFQDKVAGGKKIEVPSASLPNEMQIFKDLYTRVDPIVGALIVRPADEGAEAVRQGVIFEVRGAKSPTFTRVKQTAEEIGVIRRKLKL